MTQHGFDMLKKFQPCHLRAYRDATGVRTIGYGQTFGVTPGMTTTPERASLWLDMYLSRLGEALQEVIKVDLKSYQWDAVMSFTFSVGLGNFKKSHLLEKINRDPEDPTIFLEFGRWIKAKGNNLSSLARRRAWEASRWTGNE